MSGSGNPIVVMENIDSKVRRLQELEKEIQAMKADLGLGVGTANGRNISVPEAQLQVKDDHNYTLRDREPTIFPGLYCLLCRKEAAFTCVDEREHEVVTQTKARRSLVQPQLDSLEGGKEATRVSQQRLEAVIDRVAGLVSRTTTQIENDTIELRLELDQVLGRLDAVREELDCSLSGDVVAFEGAKLAVETTVQEQAVSTHGTDVRVAELTDALNLAEDADATFELVVQRGELSWRTRARLQDESAAQVLAARLFWQGLLQQESDEGSNLQSPCPTPSEGNFSIPNEVRRYGYSEMAMAMKKNSRVVRGKDWPAGDKADAQGEGTVEAYEEGVAVVKWDVGGDATQYLMGKMNQFQLRLVPSRKLLAKAEKVTDDEESLDATTICYGRTESKRRKLYSSGTLPSIKRLYGLRCAVNPLWVKTCLEEAKALEELEISGAGPPHHAVISRMTSLRSLVLPYSECQPSLDASAPAFPPQLQELRIGRVSNLMLQQALRLQQLRRLEIQSSVPLMQITVNPPAEGCGLRWLRAGVYPLNVTLNLLRAHSATLEEVELVASTDDPYGCPDLYAQLAACRLHALQRLALVRCTAAASYCRHEEAQCRIQKMLLWGGIFSSRKPGGLPLYITCSECD